jgi:uncharacterized protein YndB with AHSA1/START domain
MATESIGLSAVIPASPREVFAAWLDSATHSAMTGEAAKVDPRVGGAHSAWGGYIQGETLELDPGKRIVQSWRTRAFPPESAPSRLEITLVDEGGATRLLLAHTEIPAEQGAKYKSGWVDHYFKPMIAHFTRTRRGAGKAKSKNAPVRKKAKVAKKPKVTKKVPIAKKPKKAEVAKKAGAKKVGAKSRKPAARKPVTKKKRTKKKA